MKLKLAARKSDLARIQAFTVGAAIRAQHPDVEIEYLFRESLGDLNQQDPLWRMPRQGVQSPLPRSTAIDDPRIDPVAPARRAWP